MLVVADSIPRRHIFVPIILILICMEVIVHLLVPGRRILISLEAFKYKALKNKNSTHNSYVHNHSVVESQMSRDTLPGQQVDR